MPTLGPVLVGSVEHPGVQLAARAVGAVVAERAFLGLVEAGRVPVGGDGDVADRPAHSFGHIALSSSGDLRRLIGELPVERQHEGAIDQLPSGAT
jgi:hypothetical protein